MKGSFFKTNEGQLTLVFVAILIVFVILLIGLKSDNTSILFVGMVVLVLFMLVSPIKKIINLFSHKK